MHREVRYCWDVDGSLVLKARLPADVGALVLKALEAAVPETPPDEIDRPSWSRRLACDSSLIAIVEDAKGEPLNVGRKTRSIPPALQRALKARDKGCRFPGCTHTKYTDAHRRCRIS